MSRRKIKHLLMTTVIEPDRRFLIPDLFEKFKAFSLLIHNGTVEERSVEAL